MPTEFLQWIFGEFIPFGDLVSDLVLVANLPTRDEVENSSLGEFSLYGIMRWMLYVGTVVGLIPEIALFAGILVGVVIGVFLAPATWAADGAGQGVLTSTMEQTRVFMRYILSESKGIIRFMLFFNKDLKWEWSTAPALAMHHMFLPLYGLASPFALVLGICSRLKKTVRAENGPSRRGQRYAAGGNEVGDPWYAPLIFVQVVAGVMTEVSSVFFAFATGNVLSIVSAVFGLYCLVVSILVSVMKGPKPTEGADFAQRRRELAEDVDLRVRNFFTACGTCVCGILTLAFGAGVSFVPFFGLYLLETGEGDTGRIVAIVGLVVFVILWFCLAASVKGSGFFVGLGIVMSGVGTVYLLTVGPTTLVISLMAVGGALFFLSSCAACSQIAEEN